MSNILIVLLHSANWVSFEFLLLDFLSNSSLKSNDIKNILI
jgi:hypothetical protein